MKQLLDFIYPTFCIFCKNKIDFTSVLCSTCSEYLILEMDDGVMHVMEENPITKTYLKFIRNHYPKSHIETLAAFTVIKYYRLFNKPLISISASKNKLANMTAKYIAKSLNVPFLKRLQIFSKQEPLEEIFFYFNNKEVKKIKII